MGPIVILDKSAIQCLAAREVMVLHQYYSLNIAPILLIEMLGDLKKPAKDSLPADAVADLANKALPGGGASISEIGYAVDSTSHNILWRHNFGSRVWGRGDYLLRQSVKQETTAL